MGCWAAQSIDVRGTFVRKEHVKMCALNDISAKEAKLFHNLGFSFFFCMYAFNNNYFFTCKFQEVYPVHGKFGNINALQMCSFVKYLYQQISVYLMFFSC